MVCSVTIFVLKAVEFWVISLYIIAMISATLELVH